MRPPRIFTTCLGLLIIFATVVKSAHDIWSATLVYVLTLVLLLAFVIWSTRKAADGLRVPIILPVVAMLTVFSVSSLRAPNPSESYLSLMDWASTCVVFYLGINFFYAKGMFRYFTKFMVPVLWVQAAFVIGEIWTKTDQEKMGTMINANLLAAFAVPWLLIIAYEMWNTWKERNAWWKYYASAVVSALVCLVLAQSSAGWICLLLGLAVMAASNLFAREMVRKYLPMVLIVVGILIAVIVWRKFTEVYDPVLFPQRNSSNRLFWWAAAVKMFLAHPFVGVGLGNFPSAYMAFKVGGIEHTMYAHSTILSLLAETGLAGFSCMAIFLVGWCMRFGRTLNERVARAGFAPAILSISVLLSISIGIEYLGIMMSTAIIFSGAIAHVECVPSKPRVSTAVILGGLVLAALPYLISPFFASRFSVDGRMYAAEGRLDEAEKSFKSAIELDDRPWEPYRGLAQVSYTRGDAAAAVEFQKKAIERNKLNRALKEELSYLERFLR